MENAEAVAHDSEKYTKEVDILKIEKEKPRKQVEVLKQEIAQLREMLRKKRTQRVCATANDLT